MIDALGFKGIWGHSNEPSTAPLETLKAVRRAVETASASWKPQLRDLPKAFLSLARNLSIDVRQLSDTLVVAASIEPRRRKPRTTHEKQAQAETGMTLREREAAIDGMLRYVVSSCVCSAMQVAALATPPLALRGAVTVGHFLIEDTMLIGPAVDEAAGLMQLPDGAFVWLAPSARRLKAVTGGDWGRMAFSTMMPLRDGREIGTTLLSPYAFADKAERKKIRAGLVRAMKSDHVDVVIKRQNTLRFLDYLDIVLGYREKKTSPSSPDVPATDGAMVESSSVPAANE